MKTRRMITAFVMAAVVIAAGARVWCKPVSRESGKILLNGTWKLAVMTPDGAKAMDNFYRFDFDQSGMGDIQVPLNWEMAGFEDAKYATVSDNMGFYRHEFEAAAPAPGERLMLHFEGVLYGAEVWLNEKPVGKHIGGFTGFELDITDAVKPGKNLLAVKVEKGTIKSSAFDCHDDWALSGIYRDVYLYKVPETHIDDITVVTDLDENYRDAELSVTVNIENTGGKDRDMEIAAELLPPGGGSPIVNTSKKVSVTAGKTEKVTLSDKIANPDKWTAETPALYKLVVTLSNENGKVETTDVNVGFREITIDGDVFKVNGVPLKLRGANRHEINIEHGRTFTTEQMLLDIRAMKTANINSIRTSHYPPDPEFLDLTDTYGMYVIDEIPFGYGDVLLSFPEFIEPVKQRAAETISRDKNHPSVIIWSAGNENKWSLVHGPVVKLVEKLDPTRPKLLPETGFSWNQTTDVIPPVVELLAAHYPSPMELDLYVKDQKLKGKRARPIIMTEFLHALGRQIDTRATWDIIWRNDDLAGGFVWHWMDQGILRPIDGRRVYEPGDKVPDGHDYLFVNKRADDNHIIDSNGFFGTDGITYPDRTPQADFYEFKKIYTPVYFADESLIANPGANRLSPAFQNRFDFTDIEGIRYEWRLLKNFDAISEGKGSYPSVKPHQKSALDLEVNLPKTVYAGETYILEISSFDLNNFMMDKHQFLLEVRDKTAATPAKRKTYPLTTTTSGDKITVSGGSEFGVTFNTAGATIESVKTGGGSIPVKGPALNAWRPLLLVEMTQTSYVESAVLPLLKDLDTTVKKFEIKNESADEVLIEAEVFHGVKEKPEMGFLVRYNYKIESSGDVDISYEIAPRVGDAKLLELGVKFDVPAAAADKLTVVGRGPDTYPCSIKNTETSFLQKMTFSPDDPGFSANKTEVSHVSVSGSDGSLDFDMPAPSRTSDQMNFRTEKSGLDTTLYFNSKVKNPFRKKGDPPKSCSVFVSDGDTIGGRVIMHLASE